MAEEAVNTAGDKGIHHDHGNSHNEPRIAVIFDIEIFFINDFHVPLDFIIGYAAECAWNFAEEKRTEQVEEIQADKPEDHTPKMF